MHGLHSRYPEEKNKMIAVNHKLLEQVKVVAILEGCILLV